MIPVARPWMDEQEAEAARRAILSGWVTQGPEVAAFEREFAARRRRYRTRAPSRAARPRCTWRCWPSASDRATRSLPSATRSSRRRTPSAIAARRRCSSTSTRHVQHRSGAASRRRSRPQTQGHPRASISSACRATSRASSRSRERHGMPVIEDAACAIGSEIEWQGSWERIGKPHGDIACFSFHPRKLLSTGDGGMLTTVESGARSTVPAAAAARDERARCGAPRVAAGHLREYPVVGFNYRMTDIQAAIGREQLKRLPAIVARRRELAARYEERLQSLTASSCRASRHGRAATGRAMRFASSASIDQRALMQRMLDAGISTRRGVMNVHREAVISARIVARGQPLSTQRAGARHGRSSCRSTTN